MLIQLHIENIAIISSITVDFNAGLNILTGETGAGKSIIIDSINLILGARTSKDLIRRGCDKAYIEAVFSIDNGEALRMLKDVGIDVDDDDNLIISRELSQSGKNICRVNGRTVSTNVLKEIAVFLIDIHGQHDNQALLDPNRHIEFLDKYCSIDELKRKYAELYQQNTKIKNEIKKRNIDDTDRQRRIELYKYQSEEIGSAHLKAGEDEELIQRRTVLANAEKITNALTGSYYLLYDGDDSTMSAYDGISRAVSELSDASRYDAGLNGLYDSLESLSIQLEEVCHEIREHIDNMDYDDMELEKLEARLHQISTLKRKYGGSIEEILCYNDKIEKELNAIVNVEEDLLQLRQQLNKNTGKLSKAALNISEQRKQAAAQLEDKIMGELHSLDMTKVTFKVNVAVQTDSDGKYIFNPHGVDSVEFLISTNPGEPLKPLVKIASGGEMSRIMLAIKNILADADTVGTLIFDEIDTGVSGRAAQKIAQKLDSIGRSKQVLCITHLAQIASMADCHYLIEKVIVDDHAEARIKGLDWDERKRELARITGGAEITALTLKHVEEMLEMAKKIKSGAT